MDELTGILGALTGLATVVLSLGIAFWAIYLKHQKRRLQYEERRLMIEKGLTPPPMLPEEPKKRTPEESLRRGLIQVFLGVGLAVGYAVLSRPGVGGPPDWVAGLAAAVIGFLGLGHLAYYFIARRASQDAHDQTDAVV